MRKSETIYKAMVKDCKANGGNIIQGDGEGFTFYASPYRAIMLTSEVSTFVIGNNTVYSSSMDFMRFFNMDGVHRAKIDRDVLNSVTTRRSSKNGLVKITSDDGLITAYANADYIRDFCDLFDTCFVGLSKSINPIMFVHNTVRGMVLPVRYNEKANVDITDITPNTKTVEVLPKKNDLVKTWYHDKFPTDDYYNEMNGDIDFRRLYSALKNKENLYKLLGNIDSTIRERLFEVLAKMHDCSYDDIYQLWLHGAPASEDQIDEVAVEEVAPAHETATENATDTNELTKKLESIEGINVEVIGTWVWVDGDTKPHKEELKALGFRWSRNRGKWYKGDTSKYRGKYKSQYKDFGAMRQAYA